jgi:hypothetical protein
MTRSVIVVFLLAGVAYLGCGDKKEAEEPKKEEPAAAKPSSSAEASEDKAVGEPKKEESATAKAEAPKAPGPEVEQCNKILDKAWIAVQPALKMFKVEDPASIEESYKKSAQTYFVERCQKLTQELRDCLEAAENPIVGINT